MGRCWKPESQERAYLLLANSSRSQNESRNEIMYYEKFLSVRVVRTLKHQLAEANVSEMLGELYKGICKYHTAMDFLQNALAIQNKLKFEDYRQRVVSIYIKMGWVYLNHGANNKQNALKVFGVALSRARLLFDEERPALVVDALWGMSLAYYDFGEWDRAIEAFENSLVECSELTTHNLRLKGHTYLANAYLEKYRTTLRFDGGVEERDQVLNNALDQVDQLNRVDAAFDSYEDSTAAAYITIKMLYFSGRREQATTLLEQQLDSEVNQLHGGVVLCHCCHQRHGESVQLLICSECKVTNYCTRKHQKKKWRERFVDHRMLCPFLKRWRREKRNIKKGERSRDSLEAIMNDFFDMIHCEYSVNTYVSGLREVD
jgi:tetratricopeptide (TPR) repeat protein